MASMPTLLRDSYALLDPVVAKAPDRSDAISVATFHRVGGRLLRTALHPGRREAAAAAVEVFRDATETAPAEPSLRNSLGAALLALVRFESQAAAPRLLNDAAQAFQAASDAAGQQAMPRAARLRYEINLAVAQWLHGERIGDHALIERAADSLRSIASELSPSSAYWAHVQDNLGNALLALGHTAEAIVAFDAALGSRQTTAERARSLNNRGTAHAASGRYDQALGYYREALLLLTREQSPLAWGLTQHNLASALLREALSGGQPDREAAKLQASVAAFRAALDVRQRELTPSDWAVTTVNMAGALLSLGTSLCTTGGLARQRVGIGHIREAIELYQAALPELAAADQAKTAGNQMVALQLLGRLTADPATGEEIRQHSADLLSFAKRRGLGAIADAPAAPDPASLGWPTETYSQAHKELGEDIVQFLTRAWGPLIQAGAVDLRTLRTRDPSAAKAIDNYQQRRDPVTGLRRRLPAELDIPTKREVNDRLAAGIAHPGDRPARLDWALRSRARRARLKDKA